MAALVETGEPTLFEIDVPGLDRWFEVRVSKEQGERFSCLFLDISARKLSDVRRAAMTELGDRLRNADNRTEIARVAAEILGRTLKLSHAGYGEVETILVEQEWTAPGLGSINGLHQFRDYGSYIEDLKAGEAVIIDDVSADPRAAGDAEALAAIDIRALLNLPIMEHGRFVSLFYALKADPHGWTGEEIAFARNVADRTRAAIARVQAKAQQRTINLELSHRMKNMLAMVQSIATQTMRTATDMDTAKNVLANRLITLSKSHDLLLGGTLNGTTLQAVAEKALEPHADRSDRFAIVGPALNVGATRATRSIRSWSMSGT